MTDTEIAVLGGGIAGCLVACRLSDLGHEVLIVEQREQLMDGASRWNDGKIHLGYTFTGTNSLATAQLMQQGAAVFIPILERLMGEPVADSWLGSPTIYVVDGRSLFDKSTLWDRAQAVASLLRRSARRWPRLGSALPSGTMLERLNPEQASRETGQASITDAWRTTERHVSTREVAQRVRAAVANRGIPVIRGRVQGIAAVSGDWRVELVDGQAISAAVAVNCLWESRAMIDRLAARAEEAPGAVSIRYKHCLFGTGASLDHLASSTRILGAFGDVATYRNGDAYMSWYPAALSARSDDGIPPTVREPERARIIAATLAGLGLPETILEQPGAAWAIHGGYIVAHGYGDITDVESPLHVRDRPRVRELRPGFVSVDTGKYTLGPLMAERAVKVVSERLRAMPHKGRSRRIAAA